MTDVIAELKKAQKFLQDREPDEAWDVVNALLVDDPNDPRILLAAAEVQEKAKRLTTAYQFAERAVHKAPNISGSWLMFGRMADLLYRFEEAEMAYKKSFDVAPDAPRKAAAVMNLGGLYLTQGRWEESEAASRKALELKPGAWMALGNLGMACLAQKKWIEGWKGYEAIVGSEQRKQVQYANEPTWKGEKRKTVVVHGEQGLGDEICFASMLPDLIKDSKKVIFDCDHRLKGLFQRSFPQARVYGTRWAKEGSGMKWAPEDCSFDSSITLGGLGRFYRTKDEDFTQRPYLKPDPDRVTMWKALFAKQGKPVIGIAWTGGTPWTAAKFRKASLEEMAVLLGSKDAHYVSLQYKDASKEIEAFNEAHPRIKVTQYPFGTLTQDYDDTAAMVAALDCVVSVPTAVVHLAAAVGTPVIALQASVPCWKFASKLPIPGVRFVPHNQSWGQTIADAIPLLADQCSESSSGLTLDSRLPTTSFSPPLSGIQVNQSQSRPLSLSSSR